MIASSKAAGYAIGQDGEGTFEAAHPDLRPKKSSRGDRQRAAGEGRARQSKDEEEKRALDSREQSFFAGLCKADYTADAHRQCSQRILGPGVWVKPWDSFVDAYANLRARILIGISGIDGEFYAWFQRDSELNWDMLSAVKSVSIGKRVQEDEIPVLVDIIEPADQTKIVSVPSIVGFNGFQEIEPGSTEGFYFSAFDGLVKPVGSLTRISDGKGNFVEKFLANSIVTCDRECQVIESASHIVDGVPYYAWKSRVHRTGLDKHRFLQGCRIRVADQTISIVTEPDCEPGLEITDVLVGPLKFLPSSSYTVQD